MQCGEDAQLRQSLKFKMGYFRCSQKLWINNKQDLHDAWDILRNGERHTLWALGTAEKKCKKQTRESLDLSDDDTDLADRYAPDDTVLFLMSRTCAHES